MEGEENITPNPLTRLTVESEHGIVAERTEGDFVDPWTVMRSVHCLIVSEIPRRKLKELLPYGL